ncbi:hypothetical protein D4Q80_02680 [bacterium]|nr:MAG: hypothetical protein D4Q80_02680 [bacterium]
MKFLKTLGREVLIFLIVMVGGLYVHRIGTEGKPSASSAALLILVGNLLTLVVYPAYVLVRLFIWRIRAATKRN